MAHVLAAQYKVGHATIERDGAYARAVDAIAEVAGPEARQALLARETKITQQEVKQLADVAKVSPPTAQEAMKGVQGAKTPKVAKQIVQAAVEAVQKEGAAVDDGTLAKAGVSRAALDRLVRKPTTHPRPVAQGREQRPVALVLDAEAPPQDDPPAEVHRNRWGSVTEAPADAPSSAPRRVIRAIVNGNAA